MLALPTRVTPGVSAATRLWMLASVSQVMPGLRVPPKALTFAFFRSTVAEAAEVLGVLGVRAGEAALDPVEAELVELLA